MQRSPKGSREIVQRESLGCFLVGTACRKPTGSRWAIMLFPFRERDAGSLNGSNMKARRESPGYGGATRDIIPPVPGGLSCCSLSGKLWHSRSLKGSNMKARRESPGYGGATRDIIPPVPGGLSCCSLSGNGNPSENRRDVKQRDATTFLLR